MSVLIKGLNLKPCKDGVDGKGLVIIGYDDELYAVAHEQIIPLTDHGDLIDRDKLIFALEMQDYSCAPDTLEEWTPMDMTEAEIADLKCAPAVIPAERSEE